MKRILFFLVLFIFIGFSQDAQAQCAMCKAVAESGIEGGGSVGTGLNQGILYLMAVPYILLGSLGFAWYKYSRKNKALPSE